jgi:hypothetical protein
VTGTGFCQGRVICQQGIEFSQVSVGNVQFQLFYAHYFKLKYVVAVEKVAEVFMVPFYNFFQQIQLLQPAAFNSP